MRFPKPTNLTAGLLCATLALVGYQSFGNRPAPSGPTQPAIIATFDLEKTFNALHVKAAADSELLGVANRLNSDGETMGKAIKEKEKNLEDLLVGSDKYKEALDKYSLAGQEYRAYIEFCKAKIDIERARTLKRIYADIRKAVATLATENHYAVVFVDDSVSEIPAGNEEETNRQISARRMVFTSPEVDITSELISRMNADFIAGGGVVPPKPAAVPAPTASSGTSAPPPVKPANKKP